MELLGLIGSLSIIGYLVYSIADAKHRVENTQGQQHDFLARQEARKRNGRHSGHMDLMNTKSMHFDKTMAGLQSKVHAARTRRHLKTKIELSIPPKKHGRENRL